MNAFGKLIATLVVVAAFLGYGMYHLHNAYIGLVGAFIVLTLIFGIDFAIKKINRGNTRIRLGGYVRLIFTAVVTVAIYLVVDYYSDTTYYAKFAALIVLLALLFFWKGKILYREEEDAKTKKPKNAKKQAATA